MLPKKIIKGRKNCTKCNNWKLLVEYNSGKSIDGKRSQCRDCERDYKMILRYGLSTEQVKDFWDRKKCEICGCAFINYGSGKGRHKCIDHSHLTGLARGVLCNACNSAIAYLGDSPEIFEKAIQYLTLGGSFTKQFLHKELENEKQKN